MISQKENSVVQIGLLTDRTALKHQVELAVQSTPVIDVHTHLFPPRFGGICLYGIDELLTYHYLVAEVFRSMRLSPSRFWQMSKAEQADLIWKTLFVDNTPISEAARGVVTILKSFGLDPRSRDLTEAREFFDTRDLSEHVNRVLDMACVKQVVMTNDPFDDDEAVFWNDGKDRDSRFAASIRLDGLLNQWPTAIETLSARGWRVQADIDDTTTSEVRRFLDNWVDRLKPQYMAVSLPDDYQYPANDSRNSLIKQAVIPTAKEHKLSLALMVGVRRGVNPALRAAGDGVGRADVSALERLCAENPDVRFMATYLSRENQHELCVSARKFNNLMPFGCWWFLSNPSIVSEITRERLELLGPSFIPQHSDARVLEQLIYKWKHSRTAVSEPLYEAYERLLMSGRPVTRHEIMRDVERMFSGNFLGFQNQD
jgi:hypothetical protein